MKKFLCCVLIAVIATSMTNAFCESLIVVTYSYKVSPAIVDGEIVLKITFVHDTDFLSFYWDDELQNMPLWVKIATLGVGLFLQIIMASKKML